MQGPTEEKANSETEIKTSARGFDFLMQVLQIVDFLVIVC